MGIIILLLAMVYKLSKKYNFLPHLGKKKESPNTSVLESAGRHNESIEDKFFI